MRNRPELNEDVAVVAEWIARVARSPGQNHPDPASPTLHAIVTEPVPSTTPPPTSQRTTQEVIVRGPTIVSSPTIVIDPRTVQKTAIVPLRIGDSQIHLPVSGSTAEIGHARQSAGAAPEPAHDFPTDLTNTWEHAEPDAAMIAKRCAIKARACEAVLRRENATPSSLDAMVIGQQIADLIAEAKALPHCFLWAPFRQAPLPPLDVVELSARAYENTGLAAALVDRIRSRPDARRHLQEAIELLAEAQSGLRAILFRTWLTKPEQDQEDAFHLVRQITEREQIYVARHLRLDDPADPALHGALRARIDALNARLDAAAARTKEIGGALNKLKYHLKRLAEGREDELPALELAAGVAAKVGLVAEDNRVREVVAPFAPRLRDRTDLPALVAGAILAQERAAAETESDSDARKPSTTLLEVRELLRGARAVVLGGQVYDHAAERMKLAFELNDVEWVSIREHASSAPLESAIADARTRIVIALVKLAGHQHIDDARRWAAKFDRPLVMVTGGYNPEQLAAAITEQASDRLRSRTG